MFSTDKPTVMQNYAITVQVRRSLALTAVDQMTWMRVKMKTVMEERDAGNEEV